MVYVQHDDQTGKDMVCVASFSFEDKHSLSVTATSFEGNVYRMYYNADTKDLMVEDINGAVYEGI